MARLKGFQKLMSVDEGLQRFLAAVPIKLKNVSTPLSLALNRVQAVRIIADTDLPRVDRSTVDGYAVEAGGTVGATQFRPKTFRLVEKDAVGKGQAKRIWTGNPTPRGANAVVMLENTKLVGNKIELWSPAAKWENVSKRGEDVKKGETVVDVGTRLKPQHLGLMASLGIAETNIFQKPRIAILATGNELTRLGDKLREDQVFDSNRLVLTALSNELGAQTLDLGIARDDTGEILEKIETGLKRADAVITSGGTSVGGMDLVPEAVSKIGKPGVIVHGVAMRPGMPTALAVVRNKPTIILPGNPVAAMLSFEVFARPLISKMLGLRRTEPRPMLKAKMTKRITTTLGRRNLVRVRVFRRNHEFLAEPVSAKGSGLLSTMTTANGYVIVPENVEGLEEGDVVFTYMFDDAGRE